MGSASLGNVVRFGEAHGQKTDLTVLGKKFGKGHKNSEEKTNILITHTTKNWVTYITARAHSPDSWVSIPGSSLPIGLDFLSSRIGIDLTEGLGLSRKDREARI